MEIHLAKTAGFCFGVDRAVKLTYDLLAQGRRVATLGPLIHNPQVVADLQSRGALTCDTVEEVPDGCEVVIRSHGVPETVYEKISTRGLAFHDATCPFVAKIHKIAAEAGKNGAVLLVAGDRTPPRSGGHCRPCDRPGGGFFRPGGAESLGRAGKATKVHLCGGTDHLPGGKLGGVQGFSKKMVYKSQNI